MIRRILGLGAIVALLGPVSCLDDQSPAPFTTAGTCYDGDIEGCSCTAPGHVGDPGVRTCGPNGVFATECHCLGCTVSPDCSKCKDTCLEQCVCQTSGKEVECAALCSTEAGTAAETFTTRGTFPQ